MKETGNSFLNINIYLTERVKKELLEEYKIQQEEMELDPITRLEARTKFGRPDFDTIFDELKEGHRGESNYFLIIFYFFISNTYTFFFLEPLELGVFFCGPRILSKNLRACCMAKSPKSKKNGAKFIFHKENF